MPPTIGIDIVEIERLRNALERFGTRFERRIFSEKEMEYFTKKMNPIQSMAGRFAVKEAFMKAKGRFVPWREIEVLHEDRRPFVLFHGTRYRSVSISHERRYAVAVVVIEEDGHEDSYT